MLENLENSAVEGNESRTLVPGHIQSVPNSITGGIPTPLQDFRVNKFELRDSILK